MMKRCFACAGSGQVMGGGMMQWDCGNCDGKGKVFVEPDPKELLKDKDNPHYKKAVKKLRKLDKTLTEKTAQEMFDKEIEDLKD